MVELRQGKTQVPKAVIFDLDGTLVSSSLDFLALCEETGCTPGQDILRYVETLPENERARVASIIREHELRDAESSQVIEGVHQTLGALRDHDINVGIITRNSSEATAIKLAQADIDVDLVLTREQAPPKPSPDALLQTARHWDLRPRQCVYVGDFRYDLEAALNARMHAAWFSNGIAPAPAYASLANFRFDHFDDFLSNLCAYWLKHT